MPESVLKHGIEKKLLAQINLTASSATNSEPWIATYDKDIRIADLGLDSLKLVEIVFELEAEFGIETDESMLVQISTLGDLVDLIFAGIQGEVVA